LTHSHRRPHSSLRTPSLALVAVTSIGALLGLLPARKAAAEIELGVKGGWRLTTDGRINNFLSIARGNGIPSGAPGTYSGIDDQITSDNKVQSSRVRTGFIESIMAFQISKNVTESTTVDARVAFWILTASSKSAQDAPGVEAREAYFKLEGDWGGLVVGRTMSLFTRGGIMLNYDIEHNYGLGSPCQVKVVGGGACGHAGFGLLFPGFHSGLIYITPLLGGLQLSAGAFDPAALSSGEFRRTPYPRMESELTYATSNKTFRAFAGGLWQRVSKTSTVGDSQVDFNVDALGFNYGFGLNLGPLQLGASGYSGKGLGFFTPLEDNPANFVNGTSPGLRSQHGYYGAAALVFGGTRLAAGAGISMADSDADDPPDTASQTAYIKQQFGVSAGVYQTVYNSVTFALEYFGAQYTWFNYAEMRGDQTVVVRPRQAVNFINAGATFTW